MSLPNVAAVAHDSLCNCSWNCNLPMIVREVEIHIQQKQFNKTTREPATYCKLEGRLHILTHNLMFVSKIQ